MLGRLISDLIGKKRKGVAAPVAQPRRPFVASNTMDTLVEKVQQLCADGRLREAEKAIASELPVPLTADEAYLLLQRVCLPLLTACVARRDAAVACDLEIPAYNGLVKSFEEPFHYERCLGLMDSALSSLGSGLAPPVEEALPPDAGRPLRLMFFLYTLKGDLAHVVLLCDLIEAYLAVHPDEVGNIAVVGCGWGTLAPRLQALRNVSKVRVLEVKTMTSQADYYVQVAGLLASEGFDRLVLTGPPVGLSFLTGLLPASRISWLSMKFELGCFAHLHHRCSFTSGVRRHRLVGGKPWLEAPPFFVALSPLRASGRASGRALAVLQEARRFGTVFYTINREEKIRNPQFLQAVVSILEQVPDSCFVWTGKERLADIDAFFDSGGMSKRHFFAGWVVPDDLVLGGDIFLDTPVLSGTVAARAVASGHPVLTWAGARSWINFFADALERDRVLEPDSPLSSAIRHLQVAGLSLECTTATDYVAQAVMLAKHRDLRNQYAQTLKDFAEYYFFNAARSAEDHFMNFREPVDPRPAELCSLNTGGQ